MIEKTTKEQIAERLLGYCDNEASDNKASKILGISNAYISHIRNKNWDMISDDMWRKISNIIGFKLQDSVKHADTNQYNAFTGIYIDSSLNAEVYGITCQPGSGKTYSLDLFRKRNPGRVFYAKCKGHTTESELYQDILRSMGKPTNDRNINALLVRIEDIINRTENPIIIIDEMEKVKTHVLLATVDLYNTIEKKCGIVIVGTPNLKERVEHGVRVGKIGYNELYSRIGGRFVEIPPPSAKDGAAIVRAYGITDQANISAIVNDSLTFDKSGIDLRRVDRLIQKFNKAA